MGHIQGDDDGAGFGIEGTSTLPKGTGVYGYSETGPGICGVGIGPVSITGIALDPTAVTHGHPLPVGSPMLPPLRTAVYGVTSKGPKGQNSAGVLGQNDAVGGYGVVGMSDKGHGVRGLNDTNSGGSGMLPDRGSGASGDSTNGYGVWGASKNWAGVGGFS